MSSSSYLMYAFLCSINGLLFIPLQVRQRPLSFSSSREMRARAALLPATVPWKQVEIKVRGAITKEPLMLYYHDALECFKYLWCNPLFSGYMDFIPRREYTSEEKTERLYNEMMTGDRAWNLQANLLTSISAYLYLTLLGLLMSRIVLKLAKQ